MGTPLLPPYLGSWNDLMRALLHDPFLGSPHRHLHTAMLQARSASDPMPGWVAGDPEPTPWLPAAVSHLVRLASLKAAASSLSQASRAHLTSQIDASIAAYIDEDICPPPRRWPFPGPPPGPLAVASELAMVANSLAEGSLRTDLLRVSGQIVEKALAMSSPMAV